MHSCSFSIPYLCVIGGGFPGGTFWQVSLFYGYSNAAGVLAYIFESRLFGHCSLATILAQIWICLWPGYAVWVVKIWTKWVVSLADRKGKTFDLLHYRLSVLLFVIISKSIAAWYDSTPLWFLYILWDPGFWQDCDECLWLRGLGLCELWDLLTSTHVASTLDPNLIKVVLKCSWSS